MTNEMHNSYNQFSFHSFLSALYVSKIVHLQEHGMTYCITQYNQYNRVVSKIVPIVPIVLCNTVYYTMLLKINE